MHFVSACMVKLKINEVVLAVTILGIDHKALSWVKMHAHYQLMISIIDHIIHTFTTVLLLTTSI